MRLAISNIAWDRSEDGQVASLLSRLGVNAIDVAPGKYFPEPDAATSSDIVVVRDWWRERGIEITGMQALLFGAVDLNLFGSPERRAAMLARLRAMCRVGGMLGARRLVFGSPRNRDVGNLDKGEAREIAVEFFDQLGREAQANGVTVCLEPNPSSYGCNFMTTTAETAEVVRAVAHPAIRLNLDTGAIAINREVPEEVIADNVDIIGHVHASEPGLVPLGEGGAPHAAVSQALAQALPDAIVSIEMVASNAERHLTVIERAIRVAKREYGERAP